MFSHKKSVLPAMAAVTLLSLVAAFLPVGAPLANADMATMQRAVSIESRYAGDFASNDFKQSVQNAHAAGANTVTLVIPWHQTDIHSNDIGPDQAAPSDADLASAIDFIHGLGMQVVIKPHLEVQDGDWRANIQASNRDAWYGAYSYWLDRYGDIAQAHHVEVFVTGTELIGMASTYYNQDNTERWVKMIQDFRTHFSGKVTYAANFGSAYTSVDEFEQIGFWPSLDYIGIDAYWTLYPDSNDSVSSLEASWAQIDAKQIQTISQQYNKPILIAEVGYRSIDNAHSFAWDATIGGNYNAQEQANDITAVMDYWSKRPYAVGVYLWQWSSDPNAGWPGNTDYTPQHKPAEQALQTVWSENTIAAPSGNNGGNGNGTTTGSNGGNNGNSNGSVSPNNSGKPTSISKVGVVPTSGSVSAGRALDIYFTEANGRTDLALTGACTVNGVDAKSTFQNLTSGLYKVVYTVGPTDPEQQAGHLPVNCTLGDSNGGNATVTAFNDGNTLAIDTNGDGINTGSTSTATSTPASGNNGGNNNTGISSAPSNPGGTWTASGSVPPSVLMNQSSPLSVTLNNTAQSSNVIADIEVYDPSNAKVYQQFYPNQSVSPSNPGTYSLGFTPSASGKYTLKTGVFSQDWSTNYYWNDSVAQFTATDGSAAANSGANGGISSSNSNPGNGGNSSGNGSTTSGSNGGNGGASSTPVSYAIDLWWPTDGSTVQGVQPFKAMIDNDDVNNYHMYWQVDSANLNEMANSSADYPHKEALVDLSSWTWKGNGPYTLTFIAKDNSGNTLAQKAVNITVQH